MDLQNNLIFLYCPHFTWCTTLTLISFQFFCCYFHRLSQKFLAISGIYNKTYYKSAAQ
jgi:hypothetical protein